MIGDEDVAQAARPRCLGHLGDGAVTVRPGGVHLQVAPHVVHRDEVGRKAVELAAIFAQLGRDEGQAQRGVNLFLSSTENLGATLPL